METTWKLPWALCRVLSHRTLNFPVPNGFCSYPCEPQFMSCGFMMGQLWVKAEHLYIRCLRWYTVIFLCKPKGYSFCSPCLYGIQTSVCPNERKLPWMESLKFQNVLDKKKQMEGFMCLGRWIAFLLLAWSAASCKNILILCFEKPVSKCRPQQRAQFNSFWNYIDTADLCLLDCWFKALVNIKSSACTLMLTPFNVQVYIFVSVIFEDKTRKKGKYAVQWSWQW